MAVSAGAREKRDRAGRMSGLVGGELGEEFTGGVGKTAERLGVETVDRRHAVEQLLLGGVGFLVTLVAERRAGGDADGGELPGQHGEVGGRHAGRADQHDGGDGDENDDGGDQPAAIEKLAHGGVRGRRRSRAAGVEAADEEFELVADGHGWNFRF